MVNNPNHSYQHTLSQNDYNSYHLGYLFQFHEEKRWEKDNATGVTQPDRTK